MAYQALYRKWRPQTFEQVVGQTATVKTLRRQIESGRIAHAYLFCGCRGTGKTTMAKLMSRAINCRQPDHGDPCGTCEACQAILNETTMDVLELDAASNNSVDNIRELLEQVRYPAQVGKYKVYIIDEVHMLSTAAFNALLKTLEEPPEHVVFILATTEPQKLPATILSRVQRYDFGRIPAPLMVDEGGVMRKIDELMRSGREPQVFLKELSAHCRALLTVKAVTQDAASILDVTEEDEARYRAQAEGFSSQRLLRMLEGFTRTEGELRFASSPRIGLESAALHACEQSKGEDTTALLERIAELETQLKKLQGDLQSGALASAAKAPQSRASKPKADGAQDAPAAPKPKAAVPVDADDKAIWEAALADIAKTDPALFGLLKRERFIGAKGDVYQVLIPQSKKEFSYVRLNQDPKRDRVSKALTDAAGKPLRFEAVLETDAAHKRTEAVATEAQQSLIEAFGRDTVQIDEGENP